MSLRAKSVLIFSTTLFGLISAFYLIAAKITLREFQKIEQANIRQNLEGILKVLTEDQKAIEIDQISRQIGLPVIWASWEAEEVDLPSDMRLAQDDLQKITAEPGQTPVISKPLGDQLIAGYTFLSDLSGKPAYLIRVDYPRTIYQQGKTSLQYLLIALLLTGVGFFLTGALLLDKFILAPVVKLNTAIDNSGASGIPGTSLLSAGRDEIASLAYSVNRLLLEALEQRSRELGQRHPQIRTAEKAAQTTTSGSANQLLTAESGLKQLLSQTIRLVVERFGYANASIYLLDSSKEYAMLVETTHKGKNLLKADVVKFTVGSPTRVGWVVANNQPRIVADVTRDPYYRKEEHLPDTRSEVVLPISIGDLVFGALDVQSRKLNDFPPNDIAVLQTLANQLATAIHTIRLLEAIQLNLEEAFLLYQASEHIAQAETTEDILQTVDYALHQTPYQIEAFQKVQALTKTKKSLEELRILSTINQTLSVQTDLSIIYQEIHNAIIQFMGQVDFLIALYDPEESKIQIPYMWEGNGFLTVEPFPLGEGLTSILIRSRQPLMIVEDTENQAKALGALMVGKPAKSWLGAPLIAGDEVIGAIVVQDTEQEHRFTEEDQRLLSALALQVAAIIRNISILEKSRLQASREQWIREVTSKIRSSVDMHSILATTATELGKALKLRRVHIQVDIDQRDKAP